MHVSKHPMEQRLRFRRKNQTPTNSYFSFVIPSFYTRRIKLLLATTNRVAKILSSRSQARIGAFVFLLDEAIVASTSLHVPLSLCKTNVHRDLDARRRGGAVEATAATERVALGLPNHPKGERSEGNRGDAAEDL